MKMKGDSKLKILHAIHFPLEGAGAGHYVHNLASGLVGLGHDVGVVYAQSPGCTRNNTVYKRFPVDFTRGELDFSFPVFESHPLGGELNFGSIGRSNYLKYCEGLESVLDKAIDFMKPDIVNVHHGWKLGEILNRKGIPYFITLHGTEANAFDRYPGYQVDVLRGLRGANGIIALTDDQKDLAVGKYGIDHDRFSIITSGVDTDFFLPQRVDKKMVLNSNGVDMNAGQPVVLYVGRLTEVKGVEYLVDAASHFKKEGMNSPKILVAGDGILRKQLGDVKRNFGLSDLDFLGLKTSSQLLSLYNAADLVVVPSLNECFPLVPAEGMACGTPFVSTNIPGGLSLQAKELEVLVNSRGVDRNVSLQVPPRESDSLAAKIAETLDLDLKKKVGRAIRGLSKKFSLIEMVSNTGSLYSSVVGF